MSQKPALDLVALQRALVFTKLDYRRPAPSNLTLVGKPTSTVTTPLPTAAPMPRGVGSADVRTPSQPSDGEPSFANLGLYAEATWVEHATTEVIAQHLAAPGNGGRRTCPFEPDDADDLVDVPAGLVPWTCE